MNESGVCYGAFQKDRKHAQSTIMILRRSVNVGDFVKWNKRTCLVVRVYESKCWRVQDHGNKVNWGAIDPEPFAEVLIAVGQTRGLPQTDLEVINESR